MAIQKYCSSWIRATCAFFFQFVCVCVTYEKLQIRIRTTTSDRPMPIQWWPPLRTWTLPKNSLNISDGIRDALSSLLPNHTNQRKMSSDDIYAFSRMKNDLRINRENIAHLFTLNPTTYPHHTPLTPSNELQQNVHTTHTQHLTWKYYCEILGQRANEIG